MEALQYEIFINAPREKVWKIMMGQETYREWTHVFNPSAGSSYEGEWTTGSSIRFVGLEEDGRQSGMLSKIAEARPFEYVSIQHLGELVKGEERLWPDSMHMFENYTFVEKDGGTQLLVELTSTAPFPSEYKTMFEGMWPKALEKLKEICER